MKTIALLLVLSIAPMLSFAQTPQPAPPAFKADMNVVFKRYIDVESALSAGNTNLAKIKANALLSAAKAVRTAGIRNSLVNEYNKNMLLITANSNLIIKNVRLESMLKQFELISEGLYPIMKDFQVSTTPIYYNYCSSANNYSGGRWLTTTTTLNNPYLKGDITGCEKQLDKF